MSEHTIRGGSTEADIDKEIERLKSRAEKSIGYAWDAFTEGNNRHANQYLATARNAALDLADIARKYVSLAADNGAS